MGFTTPTPIQSEFIPVALEAIDGDAFKSRDLIGLAPTGTGKTLAFALPIIEKILSEKMSSGEHLCRL